MPMLRSHKETGEFVEAMSIILEEGVLGNI